MKAVVALITHEPIEFLHAKGSESDMRRSNRTAEIEAQIVQFERAVMALVPTANRERPTPAQKGLINNMEAVVDGDGVSKKTLTNLRLLMEAIKKAQDEAAESGSVLT